MPCRCFSGSVFPAIPAGIPIYLKFLPLRYISPSFFLPSDLENQDNRNHIIFMANLFSRRAFPKAQFNNLPTIVLLRGTPATTLSAAAAASAVSTSRAVGVSCQPLSLSHLSCGHDHRMRKRYTLVGLLPRGMYGLNTLL